MFQKIYPSKLRDTVLSSLDELKAVDPVTLNVKKLSSFTDYMMITNGTSNRHIQSIGDKVLEDFLYSHTIARLFCFIYLVTYTFLVCA